MTTTRIDHTGHNHPKTTAARTACRKALKATPVTFPALTLGKSNTVHKAVVADDGTLLAAACGAGLQRGLRRPSTMYRQADATLAQITCGRCAS